MFSKIKSIWASFKAAILKRMLEMSLEAEAVGALKTALSDIGAELKAVETKAEGFIDPTVAKVEAQAAPVIAQVEDKVQAAAPVVVAAVTGDVADLMAKIKDVMGIYTTVPAAFDTFAAPIIQAGMTDLDAAIATLDAALAYGKVKSPLFGSIVAVVKAL